MTIMIKTPNGRVAFHQNRKITETTETITINDNVTISLPQSLRELVDLFPERVEPIDEGTKKGTREDENPENPHHG